MTLPEKFLHNIEAEWTEIGRFQTVLAMVETDLSESRPAHMQACLLPYQAIGRISLALKVSARYEELRGQMITALEQAIPARSPSSGFGRRAAEAFRSEVSEVRNVADYWLRRLPDRGRLHEMDEVDADTELEVRVVVRMTELYCTLEGMLAVGDVELHETLASRLTSLERSLEELLSKWATLTVGTDRLTGLRSAHPASTELWWEHWATSLLGPS